MSTKQTVVEVVKEITTDPLKDALVIMINGVTQVGGKTIDFLSQEIPEVITQLLIWHGIKSGICFIVGWSLLIIPLYMYINMARKRWSEWSDDDAFAYCSYGAVGYLFTLLLVNAGIDPNLNWLQIWITPKLYLLEYAKDLIH